MPYTVQGKCVLNKATGAQVKCHPTRARALRHLAALQANVPEAKAAGEGTAPTGGGKKLTRAEAARHASLVRWKKESPFAARVQEKLAAIRAKRAGLKKTKGRGGKGKAKGGGKPKDARTPQEKANQNRAAVSKETGMGDLEGPLVRLGTGTIQDFDLERDAHEKLIEKGLAKRSKDGKVSLTPAGRKFRSAADKGDADGARAALAEGGEKVSALADKERAKADKITERDKKKAERETQRKERAIARGERSKGRKEKRETEKKPAPAKEDKPDVREQERLADREQRQKEHAEDRAQRQADREQRNKEHAEDRAERAKDREERAKERKKREDERSAAGKDKQRQTIEKEVARITAARARKGIAVDELQAVLDEMKAMRAEISEIAEEDEVEVKAGRRNKGSDQALIDEGYALAEQLCDLFESLGATVEEDEEDYEEEEGEAVEMVEGKSDGFYLGDAVKALEGGAIGAYAVRFGSVDEPDLSPMRDYFTKSTDFWIDAWDRRPMLFHHAMDEDTADAPRIGTWTKAEVKDEGVWLEGQLDKGHRYYGAIKELVRRGVLRLSSDSAPHLVRREAKGNTHEVKRWPLLAASLTPTPAEPRLTAVSFKALVAELGLNDIENNPEAQEEEGERPDEVKAQADRTRRLLLLSELELAEATA